MTRILEIFQIKPSFNLEVMKENQDLTGLTSRILTGLGDILGEIQPDLVLVQGDTTTVFAAALAAFYRRIKVGHVEAGLRTWDKYEPFPEEINRCLTDQLSDLLFVPTETGRANLLAASIPKERIFVTGNTVIDALLEISAAGPSVDIPGLPDDPETKIILMTAHRRENFGEPLERVFQAVRRIAGLRKDVFFVYPVHPNPNVRGPAHKNLSGLDNVLLTEPLDYLSFVSLMKRSFLILSDSGGVQEEAPSLNKPVLILRDKTERPEVVEAGGARLVGSDPAVIFQEVLRLLSDPVHYRRMSRIVNPYGQGDAAARIVRIIRDCFEHKGAARSAFR